MSSSVTASTATGPALPEPGRHEPTRARRPRPRSPPAAGSGGPSLRHTPPLHALEGAEVAEERLLAARADSRNLLEHALEVPLAPELAVEGDGEPVRLVAERARAGTAPPSSGAGPIRFRPGRKTRSGLRANPFSAASAASRGRPRPGGARRAGRPRAPVHAPPRRGASWRGRSARRGPLPGTPSLRRRERQYPAAVNHEELQGSGHGAR